MGRGPDEEGEGEKKLGLQGTDKSVGEDGRELQGRKGWIRSRSMGRKAKGRKNLDCMGPIRR